MIKINLYDIFAARRFKGGQALVISKPSTFVRESRVVRAESSGLVTKIILNSFSIYFYFSTPTLPHPNTHTHIYIYIERERETYIYIYRERERERERERMVVYLRIA